MSAPAIAIAIGFGLAVGWGLGSNLRDPAPALTSLVTGLVAGAAGLLGSIGPAMAGWSLLLGCTAGLASFGATRLPGGSKERS